MLKFNFLILQTGIVVAFYSGSLVSLIAMTVKDDNLGADTSKPIKYAMFCMTVFGTAEVIGGFSAGKIIQMIGKKVSLYVLLGILTGSVILSIVANT